MSRKYGMIDHDLVGDEVTDNSSKGKRSRDWDPYLCGACGARLDRLDTMVTGAACRRCGRRDGVVLGGTDKLKEVIYVEDFGVKAHFRELEQALKFALSTGYPVRVGGKSYWIQGGSTRAKETDINKLKAEWFARGQRQEREKMQAELRRLFGIDEFEEGVG